MENLKELISIIRKQKLKKIEIIGGPGTYNSKMQELFDGIHSGEIVTEADAAQKLYDSEPDNVNFKKLKYRLQNRLVNTMFFLDKPSYSEYGLAKYACLRGLASVNILLSQGARITAIELAKQILRQAIKYEITEVIVELCNKLRSHYGGLVGDIKKFETYNNLLNKHLEILNAELLVMEYDQKLAIHFAKSKSKKENLSQLAIQYEKELAEKTNHLDSVTLAHLKFQVSSKRYQIDQDFENTLKVCETAVAYLEAKPFETGRLFHFLFQVLMAYIPLKKFAKGEEVANRCLEVLEGREGTRNWYITLELYIILSFYTKNYQKALSIFDIAKQYQKNAKKTIRLSENWTIYEAFIQYFIQIKKCHPEEDSILKDKSFRSSKFLNNVPVFSSDKRGVNITILIIQVLFLLSQKKYDIVIDKVEALDAYCYRYLRKDDTFRSNCFIKMLLMLHKSGFHKQAVIRKTEKFLNMLNETNDDPQSRSILIEIVPYEYLWNYVLDSLENKHASGFRK